MGNTEFRASAIAWRCWRAVCVTSRCGTHALAGASLLLLAMSAQAQLYRWTDENGKVHYSDTVPPSANDRARRELRSDATVVRDTERALTAEEKRVAAQKSADSAKQREAQVERERKDRALIATYTDLKDFDRVRDRALSALDAEITALAERETTLNKTLAAAPPSAASGRPGDAARNASPLSVSARSELPALRDMLAAKRRDRADIAAIYASERARLATLLDAERPKTATPVAPPVAPTPRR